MRLKNKSIIVFIENIKAKIVKINKINPNKTITSPTLPQGNVKSFYLLRFL